MFLAQCFFPISHDGPQILVIKKPVVSLPHSQGRSIASERPKRFQRLGSLSCSAEKPPPLSRICVYIYIYLFIFLCIVFIYLYLHTYRIQMYKIHIYMYIIYIYMYIVITKCIHRQGSKPPTRCIPLFFSQQIDEKHKGLTEALGFDLSWVFSSSVARNRDLGVS